MTWFQKMPHRGYVISAAVIALAAIALFEMTGIGLWFAESGMIHLVAIIFVLGAFGFLMAPDHTSDGSFRVFSRYAAAALGALGLAHVIEYLGDTRHIFSDYVTTGVVSTAYVIAMLILVQGAVVLRGRVSSEFGRGHTALMLGIALMQVLGFFVLRLEGPALEAILLIAVLFCVFKLQKLRRSMPVISKVVLHAQIAAVLVLLSFAFEAWFEKFEQWGLSEAQIENAAHYVFYAGLFLLMMSFDLFRHFGGIYADIEKEEGKV